MSKMWNWISQSFISLTILPFIPFVAIWFISAFWLKNKKKSFLLAVDITNVFLIASVAGLFNVVFQSSTGLYGIILIMLLAAGLLGGAMHRKRGTVNVKRLVRAIWRISFIVLAIFYFFLFFMGMFVYLKAV